MLASSKANKKLRDKKNAKRIVLDLYLINENERIVYDILEKQKQDKNLKQYIIKAIQSYER